MNLPQIGPDHTTLHFRHGALAIALAVAMLGGCSKDRDEVTAAPPATSTQENTALSPPPNTAVVAPEQAESYNAQLQEPERDQSIEDNSSAAAEMAQFAMIDMASVKIAPTAGHTATGTVHFRPSNDQSEMLVLVELEGLEPGPHGFHIHENGDCSAPDAASAGAHLNPNKTHHGGIDTAERHLGDMGNVQADAQGKVNAQIVVKDLAFSGPNSVLQKAMVVHAKSDDLRTDPSGGSGDRVGCGVIYEQSKVLANP